MCVYTCGKVCVCVCVRSNLKCVFVCVGVWGEGEGKYHDVLCVNVLHS